MRFVLLLLLLVRSSLEDVCDPTLCVLPNCRCYQDPDIPGKLQANETPQIVVVSFQQNIETVNVMEYTSFFNNLNNPNGCPTRGTFYIEGDGTNYNVVRDLYNSGHEIGVHSLDGKTPKDGEWINMYKSVLNSLNSVGIDSSAIKGTRVPELAVGSDEQFIGMGDNGLLYDSSCVSTQYSTKETLLWPFTLDVMPVPACDIGQAPIKPFPGRWEFMLTDLSWGGIPCAVPSACTNVTTKKESFDLFFDSFVEHYGGKKSPFMMIIDPAFAKNQDLRDGAIEFLQYIRAAFEDIWIVTAYQALQWVQTPTPIANLTDFEPWQC